MGGLGWRHCCSAAVCNNPWLHSLGHLHCTCHILGSTQKAGSSALQAIAGETPLSQQEPGSASGTRKSARQSTAASSSKVARQGLQKPAGKKPAGAGKKQPRRIAEGEEEGAPAQEEVTVTPKKKKKAAGK